MHKQSIHSVYQTLNKFLPAKFDWRSYLDDVMQMVYVVNFACATETKYP